MFVCCNYIFAFFRTLLAEIEKVKKSDLDRVGEKYVSVLFNPTKTKTAVVTDPAKATEITSDFKE